MDNDKRSFSLTGHRNLSKPIWRMEGNIVFVHRCILQVHRQEF